MIRPAARVAVLALALFAALAAFADPVDEINRAIGEKSMDWRAVHTRVGDLSDAEKHCLAGIPAGYRPDPGDVIFGMCTENEKAASSIDWHNNDGNWMTPIRNQKYCGACAAFAALGALEGMLNVEADNQSLDRDLSEQHLFSCGGGRCATGMYPDDALTYLVEDGVPDESCFPYRSGDDGNDRSCSQTCSDWRSRAQTISRYYWYGTASSIKQALSNGPMATFMDTYEDFYYYGGGVYEHSWGSYTGGHGVTLVGYNDSQQCWIIKNSWGSDWGESGYGRVRYGASGLAEYAARLYLTGSSPDDDDDSTGGRDCDDICTKLITCGYTDDRDECLRECYEIRSDIASCLETAGDCGDVDDCVGAGDDDSDADDELCRDICQKLYTCDMIQAADADQCLEECIDNFSESAKDCLRRAQDCGAVEICAGMDGDVESSGSGGDDDSGLCGFSSPRGLIPGAAALAVLLLALALRRRRS